MNISMFLKLRWFGFELSVKLEKQDQKLLSKGRKKEG